MSERTIPTGGFCWEELQSANPAKAISFYQELIGWDTRAWPLPDGSVYTLFGPEGEYMAGAQAHSPGETGAFQGWLSYVNVEDVDAVAARVEALGGTLLCAPHDIPEVGRSAVLKDPEGALLALMRFLRPSEDPKNHLGCFCWRELMARDTARAAAFYTALLGWSTRTSSMGGFGEYIQFVAGTRDVGGLLAITPEMGPMPSMWTPYVAVADVNAAAVRVPELGGSLCVPPMDVPGVGRFCTVTDPAGGTLALITLA